MHMELVVTSIHIKIKFTTHTLVLEVVKLKIETMTMILMDFKAVHQHLKGMETT